MHARYLLFAIFSAFLSLLGVSCSLGIDNVLNPICWIKCREDVVYELVLDKSQHILNDLLAMLE